ncbi:sulfite exporter TauE/SafE family protein [Fluviibacterium sp. DFM31]|uniref:Probable membrane transporter protein n=1 Tax=Meridianimarinicoccus marinus TaxID=3231483 RepID=A0ABV3L405_9RHOB
MPDIPFQVLASPGLGWLIAAAFVGGIVRGFSGFGTALVFMPVAARFLDPLWAIMALMVMDIFGPLPNLPRAARIANRRDIALMLAATLITLPLGLWVLVQVRADVFAWAVSGLALFMLVCLLSGLRYRGPVGPRLVTATGGLAGFLGGLTGMPGPPVILLYLAAPHPAPVVRASTMVYLFLYDVLLVAALWVKGALALVPLGLGLILTVPTVLGNMLGGWIFRPAHERLYRGVAFSVIGASALSGLPIWR